MYFVLPRLFWMEEGQPGSNHLQSACRVQLSDSRLGMCYCCGIKRRTPTKLHGVIEMLVTSWWGALNSDLQVEWEC